MEKSWDIFPKYVNVINEYLTHYTSNKKFKNQDNDYLYLLQNGFIRCNDVNWWSRRCNKN